ncbi:MAG: hypothetical protein AAB472_02280 [Patescibacteria group bacterium]|mgnify:CR=1 FL=1
MTDTTKADSLLKEILEHLTEVVSETTSELERDVQDTLTELNHGKTSA